MNPHRAGRANVVNGSVIVTGSGTRWLNYIKPGDVFMYDALLVTIASVDDHHQLTLSQPWPGDTDDLIKYQIDRLPVTISLSDQQANAIARINAAAMAAILAIIPEWKQRNYNARAVELLYIGAPHWSTAEAAEWAAIESIWDQVKAIRAASNIATAAIENAIDAAGIAEAEQGFLIE